MTDPFVAAELRLTTALAAEARGPRRNGCFAVWVFTRAAAHLAADDPPGPRAHAARLEALRRRLSSLSVPAPLRRALAGGLRELADATAAAGAGALQLLVVPVRETIGAPAAEAVQQAARAARAAAGRA